tara:strand:- start:1284 stop:1973 length:690 start_codon:yes stop_codon:yes gene_type:complete
MKTTGTNPDLEILYEDNHLLSICKPAGVLSQEDRTGDPDALTLGKEYLKNEYNKPGNVFLGLLHRLDKPVSGVMVMAKTSKSAARISEQIRQRTVKKSYLAVVRGEPEDFNYLTHYLLKDTASNRVAVVEDDQKGAKCAELMYQTLDRKNGLALLKIKLITGRAHQIRVQLTEVNLPILGDKKYGITAPGHIALHAFEFEFTHPTLKKPISIQCYPPPKEPWAFFKIES